MHRLKAIILLTLLAAAPPPLLRAQTTESYTFTTNRAAPDGDTAGLSDVRHLNSAIGNITSVKVRLKLTGEFNGDLYGYLRHAGGFVVLLNRPGKTADGASGYPGSGLDVTLQTSAANGDIHIYQNITIPPDGSPLTGVWEPDGRDTDPTNVTDVSARSTSLTNLNGLNAAGEWTLYLADLDSGGTNQLTEWGLDITGAAAPATNHPPVLSLIPNMVVKPDAKLCFVINGSDPDGDQLTFSLDPGAPAGAVLTDDSFGAEAHARNPIDSTNNTFVWIPSRAQASTTNFITVRVTDNGSPPLSATQTFMVIVQDYLDMAIGSTNVEGGQNAGVPINLASSDGVTNLVFGIVWPSSQFTNPVLAVTAPGIASASLQNQITNLLITLQTTPGQVLQGAQAIARLSFSAVLNPHSAFVPLQVGNVEAVKPGAAAYTNYITHAGVVAVVQAEPLLQASVSTNLVRNLTFFGKVGTNYQLQYSTNMAAPGSWLPVLNYQQTNGVMTMDADASSPIVFYRLAQP